MESISRYGRNFQIERRWGETEKQQKDEVIECLVDFVKRVSKGSDVSPAEIMALPEIAKLLLEVRRTCVT